MTSLSYQRQMTEHDLAGAARGVRHAQTPAVDDVQDWSSLRARAGLFGCSPTSELDGATGLRPFRWRADDPSVAAPSAQFALSHTRAAPVARRRSVRLSSSRASGSVATLSVGFVGALDELAEVVTYDRAGAFRGRRNQFLRTARHIRQDRSERPENHLRTSSSAVSLRTNVARGDRHEFPENRASGTSNER